MGDLNRQIIRGRLNAAKIVWEQARKEIEAWDQLHADGGSQHPDGAVALRNARLRLGYAGAAYRQALEEFSRSVLNG